jgi:hypothetical protein
MRSKAVIWVLLAFVVLGGRATAQTIVGPLNAATGINGLVVDGQTINVTFETGTFASAFPQDSPYYLNNSNGGIDAANAIASELHAAGVTGIGTGQTLASIFIPVALPSGMTVSVAALGQVSDPRGWVANSGLSSTNTTLMSPDYWAVINAPATGSAPLPPWAVIALGAALLLLGARRKMRRT